MERWSGKLAIVTGASRGIGAAIAEALVRNGLKVIGIGTTTELIQQLAEKLEGEEGTFYGMECNLRNEEDILKVFEFAESELGGVDILINNAAYFSDGPMIESDTEEFRNSLETNALAPAITIREAARLMRKNNVSGHIININSTSGLNADLPMPVNMYAGSKYALNAISQCVTNELARAKANIKVTQISPGATKTRLMEKAGLTAEAMDELGLLDPTDVADAVIYALSTPPTVQVKELTIVPLTKLY